MNETPTLWLRENRKDLFITIRKNFQIWTAHEANRTVTILYLMHYIESYLWQRCPYVIYFKTIPKQVIRGNRKVHCLLKTHAHKQSPDLDKKEDSLVLVLLSSQTR